MYEHFKLSYDIYIGYTLEEFKAEVDELEDSVKKELLCDIKLPGEGRRKITQTYPDICRPVHITVHPRG
jgi:hypothetical protein